MPEAVMASTPIKAIAVSKDRAQAKLTAAGLIAAEADLVLRLERAVGLAEAMEGDKLDLNIATSAHGCTKLTTMPRASFSRGVSVIVLWHGHQPWGDHGIDSYRYSRKDTPVPGYLRYSAVRL